MLIVFVSIAVLRVTTFIVQWFNQLNTDQISAKCLYLAQAGIHDAIYEVRSTYNGTTTFGSFTTGLSTVDVNETYRRGGTAADLLMVDTSATSLSSADILGIRLQKATSSALPAVTIASMNVCWTKSGTARNLTSIVINGTTVWTGTVASSACPGGNANITDVVLSSNFIPVTRLRWSGAMAGTTNVTVQFNMLDGSTKSVVVYPASNNCLFTVKSTGKVSGFNIYRTMQAFYNLMPTTYATTSRINDYDEINTEITSP